MKLCVVRALLVLALSSLSFSCSDDGKNLDDVVNLDKKEAHKFKVDEKSGKVEFKFEIVYFGYDEAFLTEQGIDRLTALADYMKVNPKLKLNVAGHCDNRGSTEYNLALGQRRADAVRKYLLSTGLTEDRLIAVSFGEERPANAEASEKAFAENRRAEFTFVDSILPIKIEEKSNKSEVARVEEKKDIVDKEQSNEKPQASDDTAEKPGTNDEANEGPATDNELKEEPAPNNGAANN